MSTDPRRRRKWLIPLVALVAIPVFAAIWLVATWKVLKVENFAKIRYGMSQQQVEELLGGPPGEYGRNTGDVWMSTEGYITPGETEKRWWDDENRLEVFFDNNGRVTRKHKRESYHRYKVTFWDRVKILIGSKF